jgi:hypothetical protein
VMERLEAGERIEPVEVREMIRGAKEAARRDKAEEQLSLQQRKKKAKKRAEQQAEHERLMQESMRRQEASERATAELVDFIAGQLGAALPDVLRQIEVARSKGAHLFNVIGLLLERTAD